MNNISLVFTESYNLWKYFKVNLSALEFTTKSMSSIKCPLFWYWWISLKEMTTSDLKVNLVQHYLLFFCQFVNFVLTYLYFLEQLDKFRIKVAELQIHANKKSIKLWLLPLFLGYHEMMLFDYCEALQLEESLNRALPTDLFHMQVSPFSPQLSSLFDRIKNELRGC